MPVGEEQGFLEEERHLADAIIPGGGESHGMQQIVAPRGVEDEDDRDPSVEEMREIIGEMDKAEALRSCEEEGIAVDEPDNVTLAAVCAPSITRRRPLLPTCSCSRGCGEHTF